MFLKVYTADMSLCSNDPECLIKEFAQRFHHFVITYPTSHHVPQAAKIAAGNYARAAENYRQFAANPALSHQLTGSDRYVKESIPTLQAKAS
jgi:hypothetical protein